MVARKSVLQGPRVSHKGKSALTRVSYKGVPQERPTRVFPRNVPQECHTSVPTREECGRTNSDVNANKSSLMKQFALGVKVIKVYQEIVF